MNYKRMHFFSKFIFISVFYFGFAIGFIFILSSSFEISFAQLGESSSDNQSADSENIYLPGAEPISQNGTEQNIYLKSKETNNRASDSRSVTRQNSPAQKQNGKLSGVYEGSVLTCPYAFERDLSLGSKGEDVRLLQVLLNSDKRTIIAVDGAGSLGKESTLYGQATKNAIKKFQALFIEYIGVANGRFGPRTRTVMNAICNGENTRPKSGEMYNNLESVQINATPQGELTEIPNDKIAPKVRLSANVNSVKAGETFKVVVDFSEEIKVFTPDSIIIDGGTAKEIRKLSKTSFSITIISGTDTKTVNVQIEADKISDKAGNLNENASNEIIIKIISVTAVKSGDTDPNLDELINKIISSAPQCNYNNQGNLILKDPQTGKEINTTGCSKTVPNKNVEATYDQTNRCYQGNGPLPQDVNEQQRCSNTPAQYDPNRGCFSPTGALPFGVTEVQRCNNPNNPSNPNSPNNPFSPAAQQARQQEQIGRDLADLLKKSNFGNQGGNRNGGDGRSSPYDPRNTNTERLPPGATVNPPSAEKLQETYKKECTSKAQISSGKCTELQKRINEAEDREEDALIEKEEAETPTTESIGVKVTKETITTDCSYIYLKTATGDTDLVDIKKFKLFDISLIETNAAKKEERALLLLNISPPTQSQPHKFNTNYIIPRLDRITAETKMNNSCSLFKYSEVTDLFCCKDASKNTCRSIKKEGQRIIQPTEFGQIFSTNACNTTSRLPDFASPKLIGPK